MLVYSNRIPIHPGSFPGSSEKPSIMNETAILPEGQKVEKAQQPYLACQLTKTEAYWSGPY